MRKNAKKLTLYLSMLSLLLSGCAGNKAQLNTQDTTEITSESMVEIATEGKLEDEPNQITTEDAVEKVDYQKYIDYNLSVEPEYNHIEYYPTLDDVVALDEKFSNDSKCTYEFDGDVDKIVDEIKNNSISFAQQNTTISSDGYNFNIHYDKDSDEAVYTMLHLESHIESIAQIDENISEDDKEYKKSIINEDICRLKDLIIVFGDIECNDDNTITMGGYLIDENIIIINIEQIKKAASEEDWDYSYLFVLYDTLDHELNHVRQESCNHRTFRGIDTIEDNKSSAFNIESSAESYIKNILYPDMYNYPLIKDRYYYIEQSYESSLLLLGLCHDNVDINDYYDAIFNGDINKFYEFCGAKTDEEKLRVNRIYYALDSENARTNLSLELIQNQGKLDDIGSGYKVEIYRMVLNNMINYTINNEDFSFEDNAALFYIVRNHIVSTPFCIDYNPQIEELGNNYLDFLSEYYEKSTEDINEYMTSDLITLRMYLLEEEYKGNLDCPEKSSNFYFIERFPLLKPILNAPLATVYSYEFIQDKQNEAKELVLDYD